MGIKRSYVVTGFVPGVGNIKPEFVAAFSPKQALFIIASRLKKKYGLATAYLGDCIVAER